MRRWRRKKKRERKECPLFKWECLRKRCPLWVEYEDERSYILLLPLLKEGSARAGTTPACWPRSPSCAP